MHRWIYIPFLIPVLLAASTSKRTNMHTEKVGQGQNATPTQETPSQLGPDEKDEYESIYTNRLAGMKADLKDLRKKHPRGSKKKKIIQEVKQKIKSAEETLEGFKLAPDHNWYSEEQALEVAFENAENALRDAEKKFAH